MTIALFSLSETPVDSKYDFVTVVLRDIAKALGINWSFKVRNNRFNIDDRKILPFDKIILNALQYDGDPSQAYQNALMGNLTINGGWTLYSPSTWDQDRSLKYFVPNQQKKLSRLLSYDFGRGSVIRDITDSYTNSIFLDLLQWKGDIGVGIGNSNTITSGFNNGSTGDAISYNGDICLFSRAHNCSSLEQNHEINEVSFMSNIDDDTLSIYLQRYYPTYIDSLHTLTDGWSFALQLNDGTWDVVHTIPIHISDVLVSTSNDFTLHHSIDNYSRTCDGYLKCRVSESYFEYGRYKNRSYYYVLDYLPQKICMQKYRVLPVEDEADYYRDVDIRFKNIEGVNRIVVTQLDEGYDVPYYYEITDIKNGSFITTVDKDYYSYLTITSYNDNGSTVSETLTIPPTSENPINVNFSLQGDNIIINSDSRRYQHETLLTSYTITSINHATHAAYQLSQNDLNINISQLHNGLYTLSVIDRLGERHSFKFRKE